MLFAMNVFRILESLLVMNPEHTIEGGLKYGLVQQER